MVKNMSCLLAVVALTASMLAPVSADDKHKLSAIAPAADLVAEVDAKIKELETALADNDSYLKGKKKSIPQAAGVLAVVAQGLAVHDEDSKLKKSAADLRDAAISIAKAGSLDDAKKGLEAAKAAAGGKAGSAKAEHEWNKLMGLGAVMSEVNARNGKLRKAFRKAPEDAAETARDASVLALLAVVTEHDTHEVKDKADIDKWKKYSHEMETGMAAVASAVKAKDNDKGKAAFLEAAKSCNGCHTDIRDK